MVVIIVVPQTLKTGHKTSELGSVLWINVPTALHHLHKPWLKRLFGLANLDDGCKGLLLNFELRDVVRVFTS